MKGFGNATVEVLEPPETTSVESSPVSVTSDIGQQVTRGWRALVVLPDGTERWMDRHQLFCWVAERMGEWILSGNEYPKSNPDVSHLFKARDALIARLEKGISVIEDLQKKGRSTAKAEAYWFEVLEEYRLTEYQLALVAEAGR